jgi:hypothetical protein
MKGSCALPPVITMGRLRLPRRLRLHDYQGVLWSCLGTSVRRDNTVPGSR